MRKKPTPTTKAAELPLDSTTTNETNQADGANIVAEPVVETAPVNAPEAPTSTTEAQIVPAIPVISTETPSTSKGKKAKLVRDSFTMPDKEYAQIDQIKKRLLAQGRAAKKSELLRAGLAQLMALDDAALLAALEQLDIIKTGRKAKNTK